MDKQEAMEQLKELAKRLQFGTSPIEASNPNIHKSYLWDWAYSVVDAVKALEQEDEEEAAYNKDLADALRSIAVSFDKGTLKIINGNQANADKLKVAILTFLSRAAEQLERR